jgi:hypothetical protein
MSLEETLRMSVTMFWFNWERYAEGVWGGKWVFWSLAHFAMRVHASIRI